MCAVPLDGGFEFVVGPELGAVALEEGFGFGGPELCPLPLDGDFEFVDPKLCEPLELVFG